MPYRQSLKRFTERPWEDYVGSFRESGDRELMEGVVAGCAMTAYADGWVTAEERRRMLGLIRGFEPVRAFGVDEVVHEFERLTDRFDEDHALGEAEALGIIAALKGRETQGELLVQTCCAIADADGGFDAEERQAVIRICETLALDPARFGLAEVR
jgi:tellurite resistance protein TerB